MSAQLLKRKEQLIAQAASLSERFTKVQAELDGIDARIEQARISAIVDTGLPNGTTVTFNYGRAETKKQLTGVVVGSKPQEKGATLYRIRVGDGFDQQVLSTVGAAIVSHDYKPDTGVDGIIEYQTSGEE